MTQSAKILGSGAKWSRILRKCLELSNSGNAFKLLIPNDNRKIIRGWINYSCKVTNQKIKETFLGYCGSKLIASLIKCLYLCELLHIQHQFAAIVKEQRVKGSWQGKISRPLLIINRYFSCLRCTLMDFERNYQVQFLSKQTNKQTRSLYTSKVVQQSVEPEFESKREIIEVDIKKHNFKMNPQFITGFADGESCFIISITKQNSHKTGIQVRLFFFKLPYI